MALRAASPRDIIESKLPDITEMCRTYMGVDPVRQPIPIQPTAHYAMGGIPTDIHGQVIIDDKQTPVPGLYAAGECACVSVHGANRLGTNSLLDILVFGKECGENAATYAAGADWPALAGDADGPVRAELQSMIDCAGHENPGELRKELRELMMDDVGLFRNESALTSAVSRLHELRERALSLCVMDKGKRWNTELLEAWELRGMIGSGPRDRVRGAGAHGEPWRPCPRGLPQARRCELAETLVGLPRRCRPRHLVLQEGHARPSRAAGTRRLIFVRYLHGRGQALPMQIPFSRLHFTSHLAT